VLNYGFTLLALVVLAQTMAIWKMSRAMRVTSRLNDRLSHFAEALALLTDTTEVGLANVAAELEQNGRPRAARSVSPRAAGKRIVNAARCGQAINEIAATESMSESEVRLHLGMVKSSAKGARNGALRV
jgi:hypothetical protein